MFFADVAGEIDPFHGTHFFERSPWRYWIYIQAVLTGILALGYDLFLMFFRTSLTQVIQSPLLQIALLVCGVAFWVSSKLDDLRAIYLAEAAVQDVPPDSPFARAVDVSITVSLNTLSAFYYAMLLALIVVGRLLIHAK